MATASIVLRVIRECFVPHIFVNRGRPCDQNVLCDQIFAPPLLEAAASKAEKDVRRLHFLTLAIKKEEEGMGEISWRIQHGENVRQS